MRSAIVSHCLGDISSEEENETSGCRRGFFRGCIINLPQSHRIWPRLLHRDQQYMLWKRTVMLLIGYLHNLANSFCLISFFLFALNSLFTAKIDFLTGVFEARSNPLVDFESKVALRVSLALPEWDENGTIQL
jgi:hypothetical protein